MAKVQLNQKEQHWAKSREKAEEIVSAAKENECLTMHKISEKFNKDGFYFLVDLQFTFTTPKEVMASPPQDDVAEGQLTIDEVVEEEAAEDNQEEIEAPETSPFEEKDPTDLPY